MDVDRLISSAGEKGENPRSRGDVGAGSWEMEKRTKWVAANGCCAFMGTEIWPFLRCLHCEHIKASRTSSPPPSQPFLLMKPFQLWSEQWKFFRRITMLTKKKKRKFNHKAFSPDPVLSLLRHHKSSKQLNSRFNLITQKPSLPLLMFHRAQRGFHVSVITLRNLRNFQLAWGNRLNLSSSDLSSR